MRTYLILFLSIFILAACNNQAEPADTENGQEQEAVSLLPEGAQVHVVYFHGKQRCKSCVAIQNVAAEIIAEHYGDNPEVMFVEIDFSDKKNDALAEKYEIAWSSLLVIAGDKHVDLTDEAFANAVKTPDVLKSSIVEHTNNYLQNL
jgi:hypothetical protein